jgi:ribosomal-protein-serine acetyltransferase
VTTLRIDAHTSLRSVAESDAEPLFALVDANRGHLREWLPWLDQNTRVEHTRDFIRRSADGEKLGTSLICVIERDGALCGVAGFNWIDRPNRACGIGYWLAESCQGSGLMTGGCRALIRYARDVLDLNRVEIRAAVGNHKSRAIPERLGFSTDGVLRDAEWLYDHYVDHVIYTQLRDDPEPRDDSAPRDDPEP